MRARLKSRRGFSLVESLAAFAILALVLSQLLSGVSGGVRNEARADFLFRAARQGASQLDSLGVDGPIAPGQTQGRYADGLLWTLSVAPGRRIPGQAGAAVESYRARLVIQRPSGFGERLVLSTVKLTVVEPPQRRNR